MYRRTRETGTHKIEQHNLLFDVRRSIRYHHRRRAFFDRLDRMTYVASVVCGLSAVFGIMEHEYKALALFAVVVATVLSATNRSLCSPQMARAHFNFARQFIKLEKLLCIQVDEATLLEVTRSRLSIEAREPPVLHILDVICHNEQMRAMGYPTEQLVKVRWWQRALAQMTDLREDLIRAR